MQGKHLAQKKQFYIEKRRGEGVNQATIAREFNPLRSPLDYQQRTQTQYRPHFQRRLLLPEGAYVGPGAASCASTRQCFSSAGTTHSGLHPAGAFHTYLT